jgi:formate hydrogenlyase subunit 3
MITAFVGGLYALMEHNIQRLLAYHTLENIGIILLGLGAGVTGISLNQPALIALGLTGGLYPVNHSLFKSVLFLGAGIWFRTGHRDIEKLGGIGKRMPVISLAMLVGLMAMAALPPLNGLPVSGLSTNPSSSWVTAGRLSVVCGAVAGGWAGDYRRWR